MSEQPMIEAANQPEKKSRWERVGPGPLPDQSLWRCEVADGYLWVLTNNDLPTRSATMIFVPDNEVLEDILSRLGCIDDEIRSIANRRER